MKAFKVITGTLALMILLTFGASANNNRNTFGLQAGIFMPQNWPMQGELRYPGVWTGYTSAFDFAMYMGHYFSDSELRFEIGTRQSRSIFSTEIPWGPKIDRNDLLVVSFDFSYIYHIKYQYSKVAPYLGIGTGINFAQWKPKYHDYYYDNNSTKSTSYPLDIHFLGGIEFPINDNVFINGEIKYSYVSTTWKFNSRYSSGSILKKLDNVSLGGTSLKIGIGRRF